MPEFHHKHVTEFYPDNDHLTFHNSTDYLITALGKKKQVCLYEGISKSFRTGRLEGEMQMVQLSATRCRCIGILWGSLVSSAVLILCIASQRMFIAAVYFVID